FRDRLYPNPDKIRRFNQDLNLDINYQLDQLSSLRYDYSFQNELGRITPLRSFSSGIGLYHIFGWIRKMSGYINYRYRQMDYFLNPAGNYITNKIITGVRFGLIGQLYYFASKEFDWIEARYYGIRTKSSIFETGLDWYERVSKSPFWLNLRILFHDEEDTESPFSFMAGEDYMEGFTEISYRPKPDIEAFISGRIRNTWAENPLATKRIDADFYAGLRYLWDTGIQWNPVGTIEGYVFKDLNNNGLRENDEPPIEKIKIILGKNKTTTTDIFGYFKFEKVRAKKIAVSIDTSSIPRGFVLTTPAVQEVSLRQGIRMKLYFGLISNTEIGGFVFEDVDSDGKFGPKDIPLRDVVLVLDDGTCAKTDDTGRYIFSKIRPGVHRLSLDLKTLPLLYLPTVEVIKDIEVSEGTSYIYPIPLKKANP
ncbi:MAG: hypothetical protein NC900_04110, partial [Candidatus Omnitrophica bacterium]|nr:hypothetical protein [Candidatus Omnitrophota bacterium]